MEFVTVIYQHLFMLNIHEYIINDSPKVHAQKRVLQEDASDTHMLQQRQYMPRSVMPITHVVNVAVYLLRWLPASWPLSLDQPILLLPCPIDILLFFCLQKEKKNKNKYSR